MGTRRLAIALAAGWLGACAAPLEAGETPAAPGAPLEGTEWKLVWILDSVTPEPHEPVPTLRLEAEGRRARGSGGCNLFSGGYALEGERLRIGPLASTRRACAHGEEIERIFFQVLARVATWRLAEQQLELYDANGRLLVRFSAGG